MLSDVLGSVLFAHHAYAQLHSREPSHYSSCRHLNLHECVQTLNITSFNATGKASYFHPVSINRVDGISKTFYVAKMRVYGR